MISDLNEEQKRAVLNTEGAMLVLAGAGSGKTKVVTEKIAHLLRENLAKKHEILAITFTNKAANEMRDRVENMFGEDLSSMWIGTFHGICVRILKFNIEKLGYKSNFTIYDRSDQRSLVKEILRISGKNADLFDEKTVINRISEFKNKGLKPADLDTGEPYLKDLSELYSLYEENMKKNSALDFDDLILKTIDLFEKFEDVRDFYRQKFKYVFVDEYQDTNKMQYKFIKLILNKEQNITIVGDADQSIYGWRGADISNILNFKKDFKNPSLIKLERNYRSSAKILNAANNLIKNNSNRIDKNLWTNSDSGDDVVYREFGFSNEEETNVANQILSLNYKGIDYSDMAILYRVNATSRGFEEALMRESIPYRIIGGLKFYDRKEVKDILTYLKLIQNPSDDISLLRIINTPKRGLGDASLDTLKKLANDRDTSIYEAIKHVIDSDFGFRSRDNLKSFYELIEDCRSKIDKLNLGELTDYVIIESGYEAQLREKNDAKNSSKLDNIYELASSMDEDEGLDEYLQRISLLSDADTQTDSKGVNLMTVHSAKGLEFKVVFMVAMEDKLFPSIRDTEDLSDIEEERRLCYVAITRAEEKLFISSSRTRSLYGKLIPAKRSRFIDELEDHINIVENKKNFSIEKTNSDPVHKTYRSTKAPKKSGSKNINVGDKVRHKKWGEGMVVGKKEQSGDFELVISFEKMGLKRLIESYAPLEIIK